ncbi:MAG: hypothetical protein MZV63_25290 [Marinilabiliales bacterium]|nr:hypothetical protein [Marinilabiliales bacterium]
MEKAVISHDFAGYLNVTFHLNNSRKRKAVLDYNDEDKFEKFYLKEFIEAADSRGNQDRNQVVAGYERKVILFMKITSLAFSVLLFLVFWVFDTIFKNPRDAMYE